MTTYRHAPLRYVVFALQISAAGVLGERGSLDRIHDALADVVPVRDDLNNVLPAGVAGVMQTAGARFVDADQHLAVTVTPSHITVDTTTYTTFQDFYTFLEQVLDAVALVARGRACRRVGLRYIDEIRIPGASPGRVEQWRGWVDDSLLAAARHRPGAGTRDISGAIADTCDDGHGVRFAWHTGTGYAVAPKGPLLVPDPAGPDLPYFALDTDSFWQAGGLLSLGTPDVLQRLRRLHEPVREVFETSITDKLRTEVLGPLEEL